MRYDKTESAAIYLSLRIPAQYIASKPPLASGSSDFVRIPGPPTPGSAPKPTHAVPIPRSSHVTHGVQAGHSGSMENPIPSAALRPLMPSPGGIQPPHLPSGHAGLFDRHGGFADPSLHAGENHSGFEALRVALHGGSDRPPDLGPVLPQ